MIQYIVVHCTATPQHTTIESIRRYWREQLGWKNPGYHYIIKADGEIVQLMDEDLVANGVKGFNQVSVHISYIGGIDHNGIAVDNRTPAQVRSMETKLRELAAKYPRAKIQGHRDFPKVTKSCPSFSVKTWLGRFRDLLLRAA